MAKPTYIRKHLKNNLLRNNTFNGYEKQYNEMFKILENTVLHGESDSALLIGLRGTGKTTLINSILNSMENDSKYRDNFITVKLNGLIHTDDRLALSDIIIQLNLENSFEDKSFGSFQLNLSVLLNCLKVGNKKSKSVIFILDEFDLFTSHNNQILLYTLFDASQSLETPICIIGITSRFDVVELLEKRVKSRFSHRQIILQSDYSEYKKNDLEYGLSIIERYLTLPNNLKDVDEKVAKLWKENLKTLMECDKFKKIIERLVFITTTELDIKNFLISVVFDMADDDVSLSVEKFQNRLDLMEEDDIVSVLNDLTVLELCLIIAMKHHAEIYDNQPMNFEMIYRRYTKFTNEYGNVQNVPKAVVMRAFNNIEKLELITMIDSFGQGKCLKEYQFFKLMVLPHQIIEVLKLSPNLPTEVVQWAYCPLT